MDKIQKSSEKIQEALKNKSLKQQTSDLKNKLAQMLKFKGKTILCDISGSMDAYVGVGAERAKAIDVVQGVIDNFKGASIWAFGTNTFKVNNGQLPYAQGSTNLGGAFETLKHDNVKRLILLTDGHPDSPDFALEAAQGMIIDIIYIGPQPTPQFLIDLARITGGNFDDVELTRLGNEGKGELENKIKGFLNA